MTDEIKLSSDDLLNDTLGIVQQSQRQLHASIFRRKFCEGIAAYFAGGEPEADTPIEVPAR